MTRKDTEKDAERPHYYSQFWLDIAAGRRVIGGPQPDDGETGEPEMPEPAPARKVGGRNTASTSNGYKEAPVEIVVEPAEEVEILEPEPEPEPEEDILDQADIVDEAELPNIDLDEADEGIEEELEDDDLEEELEDDLDVDEATDEKEDEEEDEDWGRRGRKKPKPVRPVKPVKKVKREPRRGF
jgi:hypothetical protein